MRVGKPHVCLALHGNKVYVRMGDFQPQYALAHLHAGDGLADGHAIALQSEKMPIFQGCGGGMMVHVGYLFGQPTAATLPSGENISPQGLTYGLGGSMRVHLWKHLRVGMEGANLDEPIVLKPLQRCLVPTGLFIALPEGYEAQVRPRSGLAIKKR